jgi:hypothetical protein
LKYGKGNDSAVNAAIVNLDFTVEKIPYLSSSTATVASWNSVNGVVSIVMVDESANS